MKILYLARCCRVDLVHPVCMLASEITRWTKACGRRLYRFVCYMQSTRLLSQEGYIGDAPDKLTVVVYSDASFADCTQSSKSTSGCFAALVGPNSFFPLNALAKKQSVVSHSPTESEIVALDTAIRYSCRRNPDPVLLGYRC